MGVTDSGQTVGALGWNARGEPPHSLPVGVGFRNGPAWSALGSNGSDLSAA